MPLARMSGKFAGREKKVHDITSQRASKARAIHDHPDIVARVKAQARENEDIPTKTAVLSAISQEKESRRYKGGP